MPRHDPGPQPARGGKFGHLTRTFVALTALQASALLSLAGPRLNQLQVLGSHNSYHVAPHPSVEQLIRGKSPEQADALQYTHRSLTEQLDSLGLRQVELDLYADPQGGLFADPAAVRLAESGGLPTPPLPDTATLRRPGTKILHVPDFDYLTTTPTLRDALRELRDWSTAHPAHTPVFVLLELKQEAAGPAYTQPLPWTESRLDALEAEVLEVLPESMLLRPDDVREGRPRLRDAILERGWPEIARARGRFVLLLDNTDAVRDQYLSRSPTLAGRLAFVSVDENHPAAAWFKLNDPVADQEKIRRLVAKGFLVRTRADADTVEARHNDPQRREAALASGAQMVSTDYPEPNRSWSEYQVRWPSGVVARPNPVTAPTAPATLASASLDLEALAPAGWEPFAPAELQFLNRRSYDFHRQRRLTEASADYRRLLELEPPSLPDEQQMRRILALAPGLRRVEGDPFPLRDVVAIQHPSRPWIAYHLFWEDDIDFPEDNDPADHEVLWVEYEPASGQPKSVATYFHGQILRGVPDADGRIQVAVEWGKHGSLPLESGGKYADPAGLRAHWRTLHDHGTRLPDHPLARGWPKRFSGEWEAYREFTVSVETRPRLERERLVWVSAWGNAVLNQYALRYNFAPKTEWP